MKYGFDKTTLMAVVLCGVVLTATAIQAQILSNGSFEFPSDWGNDPAHPGTEGFSAPKDVGDISITGWTVTSGSLAVGMFPNNVGVSAPPDGSKQFLDLTGWHDNTPYGGVIQSFSLPTTQQYEVSLALGSFANKQVAVNVNLDGATIWTPTFTPSADGWGSFTYTFSGVAGAHTLEVVGITSESGYWIGLDAVQVSPVPEPYEFGIVGVLVMLGLGVHRVFSRKQFA
jgi:hypothetical protein